MAVPDEVELGEEDFIESRAVPRVRLAHRWRVRFMVRPAFRPRRAVLTDLSPAGAGLRCRSPLAPGAVLAVQLVGGPRPIVRRAIVIHARRGGARGSVVGCRFATPLTAEEWADLVAAGLLGAGGRSTGAA